MWDFRQIETERKTDKEENKREERGRKKMTEDTRKRKRKEKREERTLEKERKTHGRARVVALLSKRAEVCSIYMGKTSRLFFSALLALVSYVSPCRILKCSLILRANTLDPKTEN